MRNTIISVGLASGNALLYRFQPLQEIIVSIKERTRITDVGWMLDYADPTSSGPQEPVAQCGIGKIVRVDNDGIEFESDPPGLVRHAYRLVDRDYQNEKIIGDLDLWKTLMEMHNCTYDGVSFQAFRMRDIHGRRPR